MNHEDIQIEVEKVLRKLEIKFEKRYGFIFNFGYKIKTRVDDSKEE